MPCVVCARHLPKYDSALANLSLPRASLKNAPNALRGSGGGGGGCVCVNPWMVARLEMRARGYAFSVYSNNNTVFEHGQKEEEEEEKTHGGSVCGCCVPLCNK